MLSVMSGDTPLGGVYASHGLPVKASTHFSGEYLVIAIAQCQRTYGIR